MQLFSKDSLIQHQKSKIQNAQGQLPGEMFYPWIVDKCKLVVS
jgi:hypothetical protein